MRPIMRALYVKHNKAAQEARHREEARRRAVNSIRLKRLLRRLVRDHHVARANALPLFDDGDAWYDFSPLVCLSRRVPDALSDALQSMPR
ncbi:hypothetical protein SDRG_06232 [Saprolegnia diclina VS20]|uniref:Uncharacterized protein n=1 Tax=Saprolegnia diclina (strain VS20) TaxID=1156394 RepID=T0QN22_SAPDV|nr:hypothetical protein SDRG_06232 [Saprolegnia diclina VS20]EQC36116.1 hypothetical protein SDRG_06232 [Saprolegnia diclina VS20]|eukprot:XP_008610222.1 hypothetical protein SDRG_06232 [Saprolegnia diclina VS20]